MHSVSLRYTRRFQRMNSLIRISASVVLALVVACDRGVSSPMIEPDLAGTWTKVEKSLPPVQLEITRNGERLAARLRLSGVVAEGTALLEGERVRLEFQDPSAHIDGRIVSKDAMELTLGENVPPQRLARQKTAESH